MQQHVTEGAAAPNAQMLKSGTLLGTKLGRATAAITKS